MIRVNIVWLEVFDALNIKRGLTFKNIILKVLKNMFKKIKIKMFLCRLLFKMLGSRAIIALSHLIEIWPNVLVISQSNRFKSH